MSPLHRPKIGLQVQLFEREWKIVSGGCFSDGPIDALTFSYNTNSNQLKAVADTEETAYGFKENSSSSTTYTYNDNGNMITDVEKGITSITYNHLNLPEVITTSSQSIEFTYDANGTLLKKVHKTGSTPVETRDYVAGVEYLGGSLDAVYHGEGRVKYGGGSPQWQYYIRDH